MKEIKVSLSVDKVVKHSIRYAGIGPGQRNYSIYIPKVDLELKQPEKIELSLKWEDAS